MSAIAVALPVVVGDSESIADRARRRSLCGASIDHIGVGRVMDGGDLAMADADGIVHHLHDRRETVRGTGGGGQQRMSRRIVEMVVDAHHHVKRCRVLDRRRNDDVLDAAREITPELTRVLRNLPVHSSTRSQPRSPHGTASGAAASVKPIRRSPILIASRRPLARIASRQRPWTLSNSSRCAAVPAPPRELVHMDDVQTVIGTRIIRRPVQAAHGGAQRQATDPSHAVDADAHDQDARQDRHSAAGNLVEPHLHGDTVERGEGQGRKNLEAPPQAGVQLVQQRGALDGTAVEFGRVW